MDETDILAAIKKFTPIETIDGANVDEVAAMVDLDIACKLLIVEGVVQQADEELCSCVPLVTKNVIKRDDGRYQVTRIGPAGPSFDVLEADEVKVMRARFLLLKGFYVQNWDRLTLAKQNEVAVEYDIGYIPPASLRRPAQ